MPEHKDKQRAPEPGLQVMDLDDECLGQILTRAAVFELFSAGRLLRVCRRFRDVMRSRASRATISEPGHEALLRFACALRVLEVYFPAVGRLSLAPPVLECLSGVTQLILVDARHSDSIRDFAALPALAELRLCNVLVPAAEEEALLRHVAQLSLLACLDVSSSTLDAAPERSFAGLTNLRRLRTLRLNACSMASPAGLCFVTALTGLSDLTLRGLSALDADGCIELASALPGLVALDVDYERATDEGLAHLSSLTLLSTLDLSKARRSSRQAQFHAVTKLRSLRCLKLSAWSEPAIGPSPVPVLGMLQRLEHLELCVKRCQQVRALQGLTALTYLCISSQCSWLSGPQLDGCEAAVAALASLTSLRECRLEWLHDSPAIRAALGALRGLTNLDLRYINFGGTLPELSSLTALEELSLVSARLSDEGLVATLAAMAAAPLRALRIRDRCDRDLHGGCLTALAVLSSLTHLGIAINTVTDAQLAAVSTLSRLRRLGVSSKDKDDVWSSGSIASVALLTRLVSLRLEPGGHVCGSATSRLLSLQSLESLHIRAVGHAGRDFVQELTDGLPRLQRLSGSVGGLRSYVHLTQLTQLSHLSGYLMLPNEMRFSFGNGTMMVDDLRGMPRSAGESDDMYDDMYGSDESIDINEWV